MHAYFDMSECFLLTKAHRGPFPYPPLLDRDKTITEGCS